MKITLEFLNKFNACSEGLDFVKEKDLIGLEAVDFIKKLIEFDKLQWANWLITRVLDNIGRASYAVFAAEQVLSIFEKKYPDDDRPRKAIEATKAYIADPCKENRIAAQSAAWNAAEGAAWSAVWRAAWSAAQSAENAAQSAAWSAVCRAAWSAAQSAENAATSAIKEKKMLIKIIENGIKILKEGSNA